MADQKDDKPKIAVLKEDDRKIVSDAELRTVQKREGSGMMSAVIAVGLFILVFGCGIVPVGLWIAFGAASADTDGGPLAVLPVVWQGEGDAAATGPFGNELAASLAKEPTLAVTPMATMGKYTTDSRPFDEIAKELNVEFIVQVALQGGAEGAVTVDASLTHIGHGGMVFTKRYTTKAADLSTTEDEVAKDLIAATKAKPKE